MSNYCVYEECPDCGAEWCARGCNYGQRCTCSPEVAAARQKKISEEQRKASEKLAEEFPEGWF